MFSSPPHSRAVHGLVLDITLKAFSSPGYQTPIKREGRLLDKAPTVGLIHWEEPFGSLRSWCGAEVLGIIGQLGPVNCPECLRLRSENSGV